MQATDEVSDTLERAADVVLVGWCQGAAAKVLCGRKYHDVAGAIFAAAGGDFRLAKAAVRRLYAVLGTKYVVAWNDAPGRTAAEVADSLRRAAKEGGRV